MPSTPRAASRTVTVALAYNWAHLYLNGVLPPASESVAMYLLTVVPVTLMANVGLASGVVCACHRPREMPPSAPLLIFLALTMAVAIIRADMSTVLMVGLFPATLLWLASAPSQLTLRFINRVFVASIIGGMIFRSLGIGDIGWLPGQYKEGADRGIEWRVSLFPYVPESAFFALIGSVSDFGAAIREGGAAPVAAGAMIVFHGPHRAVLITYPSSAELAAHLR